MKKAEIGVHAKAWLGASRMLKQHAEQTTEADQRRMYFMLAHAAGFVGNSYFDIWRGVEPGTADVPFEPFTRSRKK